MHESPPPGRPLPGWGQALRNAQGRPGRAAMTLAAVAGLALCGCQQPAAPLPPDAKQVALSQPTTLRGALALAAMHVTGLPPATPPAPDAFHLVGFRGEHLDAKGRTVPAAGSAWTFTFSSYAQADATKKYRVIEVMVPGTGYTIIRETESQDEALSPIENWDGLMARTGPDSVDLLAPLRVNGIAPDGATISLSRGLVTVAAAGKTVAYDTAQNTFSAVK